MKEAKNSNSTSLHAIAHGASYKWANDEVVALRFASLKSCLHKLLMAEQELTGIGEVRTIANSERTVIIQLKITHAPSG